MVGAFARADRNRSLRGFALAELMISTTIFSTVSAALILGFISLKRNYAATADFAINHADQMRISDYLALDLRRAISVQAGQNSSTIYVPSYYDASGEPQLPTLSGNGGVNYGAVGTSVQIRYYLANGSIYRQEGTKPAVALADNVSDFVFNVTDYGKVVSTRITFTPRFVAGTASQAATAATAFHNTTLLRNNRIDINSGVY